MILSAKEAVLARLLPEQPAYLITIALNVIWS